MATWRVLTVLENLEVLDRVGEPARSLVRRLVPRGRVRDALHGVWLGHPLHPALVQVPVGCFVATAIVDALPGTGPAAPALITTGIATAVPAAAAGWTDLSEQHEQQLRVGVVHAASNVTGLLLYAASLRARQQGRWARGRALSTAGLGAIMAGGLLGGHLAYRQAAGANHAEDVPHLVPAGWQPIGDLADLPDSTPVRRMLGEVPLFVLRQGSAVDVLPDRCSHLSAPLSEGTVENGCVVCPWHGSTFRLADGDVVHGPATSPLPPFRTRVVGGTVEVCLPNAG